LKTLKSLSIVLPAYNEAENIAATLANAETAAKLVARDYEIIVMNDGSKDDTAAIVKRLAKTNPHIRLINNPQNQGYGRTLRTGLLAGKSEWIFFTDADGQFDMTELVKLIPFAAGNDFVVGQRSNRQDPWNRRLNAGIFNLMVRTAFQIHISDIDCAFKLMRRDKLHALNIQANSAMINTEIIHKATRAGYRIHEIPVTHLERLFGTPTGSDPRVIARAMGEFRRLWLSEHGLSRG
jgi:glycosyltransferase involved in cell wall biosynthesis